MYKISKRQEKINRSYLAELNLKADFPAFNEMERADMISFILKNWHLDMKKYSLEKCLSVILEERFNIELEILCKEIYLGLQEGLKRSVTANPSSTISIRAVAE